MNRSLFYFPILTISLLLTVFNSHALFSNAQASAHVDDQKTVWLSGFEAIQPDVLRIQYEDGSMDPERISMLISHFRQNGVNDFEVMLEDERFEIYDGIGNRFRRSAERRSLNLEEYKRILGFEDKRNRIADFIHEHYDTLQQAEREYDISKYVIAAILGVESDFGRNIGSFNPFNAYVSMYSEDYRSAFALEQLEHLVQFVQRNDIDVFELKSSYAGAMSFAQFIPYSLNRWFVGDDIFDMDNNILSIANYLRHFKDITGTMDGAVMRYNPSRLYTDAVLALAAEAEALYASR